MRDVYEQLPAPVRAIGGGLARSLPVKMRYGSAFCDERRVIARSAASVDIEREVVLRRLRAVTQAALATPYWQRILGDAGVDDAHALTPERVQHLPLLTKETVRESLEAMLDPSSAPTDRKYVTTGGTTGRPLGMWIDKDSSPRDWAHVVDAWGGLGYALDDKRVVFRGVRLGGGGGRRRLTYYEPLRRELYVSVFDLDEQHLPEVRSRVDRFGARYLHGYPSALEVLGRSYRSAGHTPPALDGLFAVSENLYPGQREYLEELFCAPVLAFYGMSEKAAFAAECAHRTGYHVHETYGLIELVDEAGQEIVEPGVRGEIVATGLISTCVPLIRYRTGDFSSWLDGQCPCGRQGRRLGRIEGRWDREYLVTRTGSKVHMSAINVHSAVFDRVERFRFVQDVPGVVSLVVVPGEGYSDEDSVSIREELGGKLGGLIEVHVVESEGLQLTSRGKGLFIDQRVPDDEEGGPR